MSTHKDRDFFVGYLETPQDARRLMLKVGVLASLGTGLLGASLAAFQRPSAAGAWDFEERDHRGRLSLDPFPVLRSVGVDGSTRDLWLVCVGKCGVAARLARYAGEEVIISGSLLTRDAWHMLSVSERADWVRPVAAPVTPALSEEPFVDQGAVQFDGEILDMKCYLGAMAPATGKPHKACAALCIRGGIPPALFVRGRGEQRMMLPLVDESHGRHGAGLLPFVADPVTVGGRLVQRAGTFFLAAPLATIVRR